MISNYMFYLKRLLISHMKYISDDITATSNSAYKKQNKQTTFYIHGGNSCKFFDAGDHDFIRGVTHSWIHTHTLTHGHTVQFR